MIVFVLIQIFVVQAYTVEGQSMQPALRGGDRLLVNKFIFRFRPPRAGEIIILRDPVVNGRPLVKRVAAVPGQTVARRDGRFLVDGQPLADPCPTGAAPAAWPPVQTLAPGTAWVLGDNACYSRDSRNFGPVPLRRVQGLAFLRFWPPARWSWLAGSGAHKMEQGSACHGDLCAGQGRP